MIQFGEDPCEKEYHFTATVHVRKESFFDQPRQKMEEHFFVALVPDEGTQRDMFFNAWLPEISRDHELVKEGKTKGHYELGTILGHPVSSPARCAIMRKDKRFPNDHYLYVMSLGPLQDLEHCDGKKIQVTVLPASQENVDEQAKEGHIPKVYK